MTVSDLILKGPAFSRYDIESRYSGNLIDSLEDMYAAEEEYGEEEVVEWAAHASAPGFANDYLYIQIDA